MTKSSGLAGIKKHWLSLSKAASWFLLILSPFLVRPPWGLLDTEGSSMGYRLTHFILSLMLGLAGLVITKRWADRPMDFWIKLSLITLVSGVVAWAVYIYYTGVWSMPYAGHWVVKGTELTDPAKRQIAQGHTGDLVMRFAGDVRKIWSDTDIMQQRWLVLVGLHGLASLLLATAVVTYCQARAVAQKAPRKVRPGIVAP